VKPRLLTIALAALSLPACESLPVTVAYSADIAGHEVNAAVTSGKGVILAAKRLRPTAQK
jgi:hypothetical protein